MIVIWVVILTALITFCLYIVHRRSYRAGYRAGATKVLNDWKDIINMGDELL